MRVHLTLVAKCRHGVFDDEMLPHREKITRKARKGFEGELKEFNGERDHFHLPVHQPKAAVPKPANNLKGTSVRRIRLETLPGRRLGRVHRSDRPRHHTRTPVATLASLRIVRRSAVGDRLPIRRTAKTSAPKRPPGQPGDTFTPGMNARAFCKGPGNGRHSMAIPATNGQ
ncbi:transposase [Streptomyces sp. NPDC058751]|uniref:transposase n=1 Tax=Streptomyces sp. NPDC058751 TaxID=3346623 RepID=UPI00369AF064